MAAAEKHIPKGFVEGGRHPRISTALQRRLEQVGRRAGPQRIVAVVGAGTDPEAAESVFKQHPTWMSRLKAPRVYELQLKPDEISEIAQKKPDLCGWLDIATRLHGEVIDDPRANAQVKIAPHDAKAAKAAFQQKGGTATGQTPDGFILGSIPAGKLGSLLDVESIEAIEVTGAA